MTLPSRKPNRLPKYDYSSGGMYFITICTAERKNLFWTKDTVSDVGADIIRPLCPDDNVQDFIQTPSAVPLSAIGQIADIAVRDIAFHYEGVSVNHYVIMPNHIHLMLSITAAGGRLIAAPTVSTIIGQFKRHVSRKVGHGIWQKSFHDHIIRDERDYQKIWSYIECNPWYWETDCFYNKEIR